VVILPNSSWHALTSTKNIHTLLHTPFLHHLAIVQWMGRCDSWRVPWHGWKLEWILQIHDREREKILFELQQKPKSSSSTSVIFIYQRKEVESLPDPPWPLPSFHA
jgi:hypothetical protein